MIPASLWSHRQANAAGWQRHAGHCWQEAWNTLSPGCCQRLRLPITANIPQSPKAPAALQRRRAQQAGRVRPRTRPGAPAATARPAHAAPRRPLRAAAWPRWRRLCRSARRPRAARSRARWRCGCARCRRRRWDHRAPWSPRRRCSWVAPYPIPYPAALPASGRVAPHRQRSRSMWRPPGQRAPRLHIRRRPLPEAAGCRGCTACAAVRCLQLRERTCGRTGRLAVALGGPETALRLALGPLEAWRAAQGSDQAPAGAAAAVRIGGGRPARPPAPASARFHELQEHFRRASSLPVPHVPRDPCHSAGPPQVWLSPQGMHLVCRSPCRPWAMDVSVNAGPAADSVCPQTMCAASRTACSKCCPRRGPFFRQGVLLYSP